MPDSGVQLAILRLLASYKQPMPIGYVADALLRHPDEIQDALNTLQQNGVVALDGDLVSLVRPDS